jgi:hypothetical protein
MEQPKTNAEIREWAKKKMATLVGGFLGARPTISQEGKITIYEWKDWLLRVKTEPTEDGKGLAFGTEMKNLPNGNLPFPKIYELVYEIVCAALGGGKGQ